MQLALGFIETDSYAGAIEASNVMVKTSNVVLLGMEVFSTGFVAIKIAGENDIVNRALESGVQTVKKLGKNASSHIIKDPDEQLVTIIPEIKDLFYLLKKKPREIAKKIENVEPVKEKEIVAQISEVPSKEKPVKSKKKKTAKISRGKEETKVKESVIRFKNDTIARLRAEALGLNKKTKNVKEKKIKNKKKAGSNLESLNVHQLRKLARDTKKFPIQGREISKANRIVLLNYFKSLK